MNEKETNWDRNERDYFWLLVHKAYEETKDGTTDLRDAGTQLQKLLQRTRLETIDSVSAEVEVMIDEYAKAATESKDERGLDENIGAAKVLGKLLSLFQALKEKDV